MLTSLRGKFIFIFILITVSTVMISSGYARYQQRQFVVDRARERAMVDLELISSDIRSLQQWIQRDLLVLRDLPTLQALLNCTDQTRKRTILNVLEEEFLNIAGHHQIFQQLRLLDSAGMEIVRANTNGSRTWLTPVAELQDKSDRYYFKQAISLSNGGIYISPMDLNVEQGQLQRPFMPVIRYATPLFDKSGEKQGVLVLNVFGSSFLNLLAFQQEQVRSGEHYYLLNEAGYFLYHPMVQKSFGFMLDHKSTLFQTEPDLEGWLGAKDQDLLLRTSNETGKQTLYAYNRLPLVLSERFLSLSGEDIEVDSSQASHWILLTTVDDANLLVGFDEYVLEFLNFTLLLIAACIVVAVFVAWSFSRPIVSLADAASQIHKGNFAARAKVFSRDDMGKFGNLFNAMAANLETTIGRLKRSETKYRHLFENSQDCIFVADELCQIIDINGAGRHLFGVGDGEIPEDLLIGCCKQADEKGTASELMENLSTTGAVKDAEITVLRLDGTRRECILTATVRIGSNGEVSGYEGVLRDVTELRIQQKKEHAMQQRIREEIVLAEERERRHIGQVLHEEMAQNLALVNMRLHEAEQQSCRLHVGPEKMPSCIHDELLETRNIVNVMIGQIRTMIFDLYPHVLDDRGLVAAMNWYANNFNERTGVTVSVYGGEEDLGLSESQNIYLFRAFKGLLHNAWKHAGAGEVVATVKRRGEYVRMTVDDEGDGFDPELVHNLSDDLQGIGLVSIQQWVAVMDGNMNIESQAGKGTRVSLEVPLQGS
ncbi:MAG TPA: HAMP domain-containing protein [Desulfobacterales bacterium]|nr:HAMP domain-containing protein [Desulfobacterales bacterium]